MRTLVLRGVTLEEVSIAYQYPRIHISACYNSLADKVVTKTEQPNNAGPGGNNLTRQLTTAVLPVGTKSKGRGKNSKPNSIAENNRVVGIFPRLVLGLLLLSGRAVANLLGSFLDLCLTLLTGSLSIGLDGLRFVVRGN